MMDIDSPRAPDVASGSPERFGYSWQAFADLSPAQFEQFRRWTALLGPDDWKGKSFLDVGCRGGRNSRWALDSGAARTGDTASETRQARMTRRRVMRGKICS